MCKEIVTLHIGQAGVQSSHALWELICIEHGVGSDGLMKDNHDVTKNFGENVGAMYYEIKNSRYVPRAILMDLEPTVIDEVRSGSYRHLWNPSNLVNQKEDAASNYARGYYTSGKTLLAMVIDRVDREIERCDNLSAFEIVHSFAGGTGSGFASLLSEKLNEIYGKIFKFSLGVFPSPNISEIMVESYNTILHTHTTLEYEDCVVIFDNESLFNKSINNLKVSQPTFSLMNRLISQMFSSISLSHRYSFFGSQHADVTELLTNLVPYPRIHFPVMSYSPLISYDQQSHEIFNCTRLTNDVFQDHNHVLQCNIRENKFMSCCMLYRGSITPKPIIDAIAKIKSNREINFVDWCPTGFKIGINTCPPIQVPNCAQAVGDNALCMISGNTAIRENWCNLVRKYDLLMSKRAFVHWYVSEGLEEGEFADARDDTQSLILDYDELSNQADLSNGSNDENNNVNNANNMTNNNLSTLNNSIFSTITDRRFNSSIFENKYNKLLFSDEIEKMDLESPLRIDRVSNKINTQKKPLNVKGFRKYQSTIPKPEHREAKTSQIRNTNIIKYSDKLHAPLKKSNKIKGENISSFQTVKRNRRHTKDLQIEDIQSTVTKYLGTNNNPVDSTIMIQKSLQIPLKRKPTSIESMLNLSRSNESPLHNVNDMNISQSNSSSKNDCAQIYEMTNNNKEKSIISSITGSYKTAIDTPKRLAMGGINKSKKKSSMINQLLYKSVDKTVLNTLRNSLRSISPVNHGNNTRNENSLYLSQANYLNLEFNFRHPLCLDLIPDKAKIHYSSTETLKPNSESEGSKSLKNEDLKTKNLKFSKIEIIICEPLFSLNRSSSFSFHETSNDPENHLIFTG